MGLCTAKIKIILILKEVEKNYFMIYIKFYRSNDVYATIE
jgi:hypothetical protein